MARKTTAPITDLNAQNALAASLAANTRPAPAVGMVPLADQMTDTEKDARKAIHSRVREGVAKLAKMTPLTGGDVPETDEELYKKIDKMPKAKAKVIVTKQNEDGTVAALTIVPPTPVKPAAPTTTAQERKLWAKAFIVETVQKALDFNYQTTEEKLAVLTELGRLLPSEQDEEKRVARNDQLALARKMWHDKCAAKKATPKK